MKKYKTGITFGSFDPLHLGHIALFRKAKELCNHLTVCVSSDAYIKTIKGYEPAFGYTDRILAVGSIKHVDKIEMQCVYVYHSKRSLVKRLKPDVIFVGDDWTPETFKGEGLGVEVVYLPRTKGISGTELREKI